MWLVRLALRRPYTFAILSLLIFILGVGSIVTTPVDILPEIDIPIVSVIWTYNGLAASSSRPMNPGSYEADDTNV